MPVPEFVLALRRHVGHAPLWLPAVTAVVVRRDEVLLVQRSDTHAWTPVTGIIDPGEEPAVAAAREVAEETAVTVAVERLSSVGAAELVVHPNGDEASYLDLTFRCRYVAGEARVNDDESVEVAWFPLAGLPRMADHFAQRIGDALSAEGPTRFVGP